MTVTDFLEISRRYDIPVSLEFKMHLLKQMVTVLDEVNKLCNLAQLEFNLNNLVILEDMSLAWIYYADTCFYYAPVKGFSLFQAPKISENGCGSVRTEEDDAWSLGVSMSIMFFQRPPSFFKSALELEKVGDREVTLQPWPHSLV